MKSKYYINLLSIPLIFKKKNPKNIGKRFPITSITTDECIHDKINRYLNSTMQRKSLLKSGGTLFMSFSINILFFIRLKSNYIESITALFHLILYPIGITYLLRHNELIQSLAAENNKYLLPHMTASVCV